MWPKTYFGERYFPTRYWPGTEGSITPPVIPSVQNQTNLFERRLKTGKRFYGVKGSGYIKRGF